MKRYLDKPEMHLTTIFLKAFLRFDKKHDVNVLGLTIGNFKNIPPHL